MKKKYFILCAWPLWNFIAVNAQDTSKSDYFDGNRLFSTVKKYVSLGEHRTGTPTDLATSAWIGQELRSIGFDVKFQEFPVRQFFPEKVFLSKGKDSIQAFPLWWVSEKINRVVTGPLVDANNVKTFAKGDIALIHIPIKQAKANPKTYIDSLVHLGVAGIVAITDGPSDEIIAYNTNVNQQPWRVPIILIAPKDSAKAQLYTKKATQVTLAINGTFRDVQGRNVYGTIGHGDKYIVVSTPISGWFTCGGERGSELLSG